MKNLFTTLLLCIITVTSSAHDVEVNGIYYNLIEKSNEAVVTFRGESYDDYEEYSGNITIPSLIEIDGEQYTVTEIGDEAFEACFSLRYVNIPQSVSRIGDRIFRQCTGIKSIEIPNSVTQLGSGVFHSCTDLLSVVFGKNVATIGGYSFYGCSKLQSVDIPKSVNEIDNNAFSGCHALSSVKIPNSVSCINSEAFRDCQSLKTVTCMAKNVPQTAADAFKNAYVNGATLRVPTDCLEAYKSTIPWSDFGTFEEFENQEPDPDEPGEEPLQCSTPTISIEDGKLHFSCDTEGARYQYSIELASCIVGESTGVSDLPGSYYLKVTAHATANGYEQSEEAISSIWM